MIAAVLTEQNRPLKMQCFKTPKPVGFQVLVRIHSCGLCGAQLNEILGVKGPDPFLPHLMGHEGSGVVEAIGERVQKVMKGDRVVLHWRKGAGGEGPFPHYETPTGESIGGGHITTFADHALIAENRVTRIDDDIPFDIACMFGCGISTGYGIVLNELRLRHGSNIAVLGCGGVGLNVIQGAVMAGAAQILAVDRHGGLKESLARKMGANQFLQIDSISSLQVGLIEKNPKGFDAIVDTTGQTELMECGYKGLNKNGVLMLVGQPRIGTVLRIDPALELFTGKRILVSEGGGFDPARDMPKLQALYRQDPDRMQSVITHSYPLAMINDAFDTLKTGLCGRILLSI